MAVSTYIGKVNIGGEQLPLGTTLFGQCTLGAAESTKTVTIDGFDTPIHGVLITVKFTNGNSVSTPTLSVSNGLANSTPIAAQVEGNAICEAGDILSFVYESNQSGNHKWHVLYGTLRNKVETINTSISNISSAMHFKGTISASPITTAPSGTYIAGDVLLGPNDKEYVYDGTNWIELGDESSYLLQSAVTTAQVIKTVEISNDNDLPSLSIGNVTTNFPQLITGLATPAQNETGEVITDIPITTYTPKKVKTINVPTALSVSNGVLTITPGSAMELEDDNAITVIDTSNGQNIEKKKFTTTSVTFSPGTRQTLSTETETVYKPAPQQSGG